MSSMGRHRGGCSRSANREMAGLDLGAADARIVIGIVQCGPLALVAISPWPSIYGPARD